MGAQHQRRGSLGAEIDDLRPQTSAARSLADLQEEVHADAEKEAQSRPAKASDLEAVPEGGADVVAAVREGVGELVAAPGLLHVVPEMR